MANIFFFPGKPNFKRPVIRAVPKLRELSEEEKKETEDFLLEQELKKRKKITQDTNINSNEEEGVFHVSDPRAFGSTGSLYGTQSEKSAIIIDKLAEAAKKAQKLEQVDYPERDLTINYNDKNAFRISDRNCHIQFFLDSNTLTIEHFICEGKENEKNKGKALLLDVMEVLKNERKLKFDNVELGAESLDPTKLREGKTLQDLIKNYQKMGFGPPERDGKQRGTASHILATLNYYVRAGKGGSNKTKRRQQSKKRRKSIKKNYLKRRRKSIRKRK